MRTETNNSSTSKSTGINNVRKDSSFDAGAGDARVAVASSKRAVAVDIALDVAGSSDEDEDTGAGIHAQQQQQNKRQRKGTVIHIDDDDDDEHPHTTSHHHLNEMISTIPSISPPTYKTSSSNISNDINNSNYFSNNLILGYVIYCIVMYCIHGLFISYCSHVL